MPKFTEVYGSSGGFLKASDITQPTTVTIESYEITTKDYGDGKGEKSQIVLSFVGKEKRLGLNWGNANDIGRLIGSEEADDWVGSTIKLYVKNEKIGNEMKDVIRIWPELPEQAQSVPVTQTEASVTLPTDDPDADYPF